MSSDGAFPDLVKSRENAYFQKKELELIEEGRRQAKLEADRRYLGEAAGVTDPELLEDLKHLGFTSETVMLLHLVPLVQMAWIDGHVSNRETQQVLKASQQSGISEGSLAYLQLRGWLHHRPPDQFFQKTLRVIERRLKALPQEEQKLKRRELMIHCTAVASAAGCTWGIGSKICRAEQRLLKQIAVYLEFDDENPRSDSSQGTGQVGR